MRFRPAKWRRPLLLPLLWSMLLVLLPLSGVRAADAGLSNQDSLSDEIFADWAQRVAASRASQPQWSSPLVTTSALLENRLRFDIQDQHAGNGASIVSLDGGKGVDLIIGPTTELQLAAAPYVVRSANARGTGQATGFGDWTGLRVKERLASSPEDEGDYVLAAWVQWQLPTGIPALTSHAAILSPTLGFGKGWNHLVVQGSLGGVLPVADEAALGLGRQITANLALQYHVLPLFWPQIEANAVWYADGPRAGLTQIFLTPGLVLGRFAFGNGFGATIGVGYQLALSPHYRAQPLSPAYDHAWIMSSRLSF